MDRTIVLSYKVFKAVFLSIFGVVLATMAAACSDELRLKEGNIEEDSFVIRIPNVEGAAQFGATRGDGAGLTRAESKVLENEGNINKLYLLMFDTDGNPIRINNSFPYLLRDGSSEQGSQWTSYTINGIKPAEYYIYVLANLGAYLEIKNLDSRAKVEDAVLNFANRISGEYILPQNNLPMACLPEEIGAGSETNTSSSGLTDLTSLKSLYAPLTFLCSKVRYTILFDNTPSGFSTDFKTADIDFSTPSASNIRRESDLRAGSGKASEGIKDHNNGDAGLNLNRVSYPDKERPNEAKYLDPTVSTVPGDLEALGSGESWRIENCRAWQGVVYLPENKLGGEKTTKLNFKATGTDVEDSYDLILHWGTGESEYGPERGKMYDVVTKLVTSSVTELPAEVEVRNWDTTTLSHILHGPFELIVGSTSVDVSSLNPGILWYRSDVLPQDIGFDGPKISYTQNGKEKEVSFFKASVMMDEKGEFIKNENNDYQIEVKINPAIPYNILEDLENGKLAGLNVDNLNYFEIIAGNLHKKIKANLTGFQPILRLNPKDIIVDVREIISTGMDSEVLEVEVETNISETVSYNTESDNLFKGNSSLFITGGQGIVINADASNLSLSEGIGKLRLNIKNLFDGDSFWLTEHSYVITFTAQSGDISRSENLTLSVKPYNNNYIIHFKSNNSDNQWAAPHIFVYQPLTLPSNLSSSDGRKGMTVGYQYEGSTLSAFEYCFTSDLAFKGWSGFGGPSNNNPLANGYLNQPWTNGFFIFQDGSDYGNTGTQGASYRPSKDNTERYQTGMHFNDAHIAAIGEEWYCEKCRNGEWAYSNTSGIVMEYEGNGWWKYTLSGVATPGKTLIKFSDTHDGRKLPGSNTDNNYYSYPAKHEVGIPLFEFRDNEGWFLFDGNVSNNSHVNKHQNFRDEGSINSGNTQNSMKAVTHRLYYQAREKLNSYIEPETGNVINWTDFAGGKYDALENWYYVDFTASALKGSITYKIGDNIYYDKTASDGSITIASGLAKFSEADSQGIRHAWVNYDAPSIIHAGKPTSEAAPLHKFRIYWPSKYGTGLSIGNWNTGEAYNLNTSFNVGKSDINYPDYYYYEFLMYSLPTENFTWKYSNPNCGNNHDYHTGGNISNFKLIDGIYVGWFNDTDHANSQPKLSQGYPSSSSTSWIPEVASGIYLRFGSNWECVPQQEFYTTSVKNVWKTNTIEIVSKDLFKIGDADWGEINLGGIKDEDSNYATMPANVNSYTLMQNGAIIKSDKSYHGILTLKLENGIYTLYFGDI